MADPTATFQRVAHVIAQTFPVPIGSINPGTVANDVVGWDSVSHGHLMLSIEDEFHIELPTDRMFSLENVGDLVKLVMEFLP